MVQEAPKCILKIKKRYKLKSSVQTFSMIAFIIPVQSDLIFVNKEVSEHSVLNLKLTWLLSVFKHTQTTTVQIYKLYQLYKQAW